MQVGIYGNKRVGPLRQIAGGLALLGHRPIFRTAKYFEPSHAEDRFDLVVVQGLRNRRRVICDTYRQKGVPVWLQDTPHLRRDISTKKGMTFLKLAIGGQHWLPPFACPPDRLEALDVSISKNRGDGEAIVIAGQVGDDSQHGMTEAGMSSWYGDLVDRLREVTDRRLIWRPHPRDRQSLEGVDEVHDGVSVWTSLQCAHAVVSHNSTFGLDALVAGVPAYCEGPQTYAELAEPVSDIDGIDDVLLPDYKERRSLLARVAYTQWDRGEYSTGVPQKFLFSIMDGGEVAWPDHPPELAEEAEPETDSAAPTNGLSVDGLGSTIRGRLEDRGLWGRDSLRAASDDTILSVPGVGPATLSRLREAL